MDAPPLSTSGAPQSSCGGCSGTWDSGHPEPFDKPRAGGVEGARLRCATLGQNGSQVEVQTGPLSKSEHLRIDAERLHEFRRPDGDGERRAQPDGMQPTSNDASRAGINARMRAAQSLVVAFSALHPALGAGRLEVFASVTKYTQKSWTHSVSTGEIPEEELARRWELTFGKKSGEKEAAEPAAKEGAKTAKKKRAS
jgi:hypothetical protein